MSGLTHFDEQGRAIMVDVAEKAPTERKAVARGEIRMSPACFAAVQAGTVGKGDVLGVARVAGIMALKQTGSLIPLCHTLLLEQAGVEFRLEEASHTVHAECTVKTTGKTGVEMEALTGVTVALLTIYDMCKALDKGMVIGGVHLAEKTGGKSGLYQANKENPK